MGSSLRPDGAGGDRGRGSHPPVRHRVHARRRALPSLLHRPEPVRRLDAHPGSGRQLRHVVRGLGAGGPVLLPPDRVLVRAPQRLRRRQEGLRRQPDRRLRLPDRIDAGLHSLQHLFLRGRVRPGGLGAHPGPGHRHRSHVPDRSGREVRSDPPVRVAPRCHGGPDPGLCPDPRRHHGDGRRLRGGTFLADLRPVLGCLRGRGGDRCPDRHLGRFHRYRPTRHQDGTGLLHHLPAGVHVHGCGCHRLRGGDLPPHDSRLLQGASLPRGGIGDPRHVRRTGHAQDGRPVEEDAGDCGHDGCRHPGHLRDTPTGWLLVQGRGAGLDVRPGRDLLPSYGWSGWWPPS